MQEIIINRDEQNNRLITLVEDGRLVEKYEENRDIQRLEGNIYVGKVQNILKGMQAAFVNIGIGKNSFIHLKDVLPKVDVTKEEENISNKDIEKVIRTNMPILVQVKRDSTNKKGARVSSHISLTSRFFVLMPDTDIITISQKITKSDERQKLMELCKGHLPEGIGVIIRTSAEGKEEKELLKDLTNVLNRWENIQKKAEESDTIPRLVEKNISIVEKMILDTMDYGLERIIINNEEMMQEVEQILIRLGCEEEIEVIYKEKTSILDMYDIGTQAEKVSNRKIWLRCGGFITIDKTEALTAIDVNSGKYIGKENLEKTVLKVNKEATEEIAKQIRLRDIGGIIIIDYIDMNSDEDRNEIVTLLENCLKSDRSKTQVLGFTKLNLVEMTRKHICSNE